MLRISDYDYRLPDELIATKPASPRSSARLLVYDRISQAMAHLRFESLSDLLSSNYVLVFNQTKVVPARFFYERGGKKREALFFEFLSEDKALIWAQGKLKVGDEIELSSQLRARVVAKESRDTQIEIDKAGFQAWLQSNALPAIPPYIRKRRLETGKDETRDEDFRDYQSLWASDAQFYSVAAPTASLHFDEKLLESLQKKNIPMEFISLHIGAGTFLPLESEIVSDNRLHFERVEILSEVWDRIKGYKREGKKIIAVGTTVCRALESAALRSEKSEDINFFQTDLFIRPGYKLKVVDSLITNFHLPRSSLLLLVDTFLEGRWRALYEEAISKEYRLYSYGDGMWIV